jgi:hypothetical protein
MEEGDKFKRQQFDGKNYDGWKFLMELILDEKNVRYIIEKPYSEIIIIIINRLYFPSEFRARKPFLTINLIY